MCDPYYILAQYEFMGPFGSIWTLSESQMCYGHSGLQQLCVSGTIIVRSLYVSGKNCILTTPQASMEMTPAIEEAIWSAACYKHKMFYRIFIISII